MSIGKLAGYVGREAMRAVKKVAPPVLYAYRETYSETAHSDGQPMSHYVVEPSTRSWLQTWKGMDYYPTMKGEGTETEQKERALQDFIAALQQEKTDGSRIFIKGLPSNRKSFESVTITTDVPEPIEAMVTRASARSFIMGVVPDIMPSQKYL